MTKNNDELKAAIKLINEAITADIKRLEDIASGDEQDPVLIEGETTTGHYCQMMVDPKIVAQVFLRYDYSIWKILELDAPEDMQDELGSFFGLKTVCSVEL